ncbi:hypothetical protein OESDEN_11413, partial [Oesophagostomum dentatum]
VQAGKIDYIWWNYYALDRTPDQKAEIVAQAVAGGTTLDPAAPEKQPHSAFEIDLKDY